MERSLILYMLLFSWSYCYCQNLNQISKSKGITLSGSAAMSNFLRYENKEVNLTNQLLISGNVNTYGYAIPFSYRIAKREQSFQHPFSRFRFQPEYKGVKLLIGSYSPQLAPRISTGLILNGLGIIITKKGGIFHLYHGKSPLVEKENFYNTPRNFKRTSALKISSKIRNIRSDLSMVIHHSRIHATDSLGNSVKINDPMELSTNQSLTIPLKQQLSLSTETSQILYVDTKSIVHSYRSTMQWNGPKIKISATIENIPWNFVPKGNPFLRNNLKSEFLEFRSSLLKKRMTLGAKIGFDEVNRSGKQLSSSKSVSSDVQLIWNGKSNTIIQARYNSFSAQSQQVISLNEYYDSLSIFQHNENARIHFSKVLNEKNKMRFQSSIQYIKGSTQQATTDINTKYQMNCSSSIELFDKKLMINTGVTLQNSSFSFNHLESLNNYVQFRYNHSKILQAGFNYSMGVSLLHESARHTLGSFYSIQIRDKHAANLRINYYTLSNQQPSFQTMLNYQIKFK